MPESYIQLPAARAGEKVRTVLIIKEGREVHQIVIQQADSEGNIVNPAKEDGNLNDLVQLFKLFLQSPIGRLALDSSNRLRVNVDVAPSGVTSVTAGGNIPTAGAPTIGSLSAYHMWKVPVDQRWEMIQRANIEFEVQRDRFTFV